MASGRKAGLIALLLAAPSVAAQQGKDKPKASDPQPTVVAGVTVAMGAAGPVVNWLAVKGQASYTVARWKADDPQCCSNASPAGQPLAGPPWQDVRPPRSGTYVYRVTVTTSAGSATGDATFQYTAPVTAVTGIVVTNAAAGPLVTWQPVPGATYTVARRKDGDARCCNNYSPAGLTATSWQDLLLPSSGLYVYRVTANLGGTSVFGEAQFTWQQPVTATATPVTTTPATTSTLTTTTTTTAPALATATASAITPNPGAFTSRPATVSWARDRIDLFIRGKDNALWHRWWNGSTWSSWASLGGVLVSAPSAYSWGPGHLDVYVHGTDNAVWRRAYANGQWLAWESLGGNIRDDPAVVSWGPGRVDLFAQGTDAALYHKWFDGGRWSAWEWLGGTLSSSPTVSSWGPGRLDVFGRGIGDPWTWHRWYEGGWSGWEAIAEPADWDAYLMPVSAASWGLGRVDVFTRTGLTIIQATYDRETPSGYGSFGYWFRDAAANLPTGAAYNTTSGDRRLYAPTVSVRGQYLLDLFLVGGDGQLYHRTFNVDRWGPWNSMQLP